MSDQKSIRVVPGLPLVGHLLSIRNDRIELLRRLARDHGDMVRIRVGLFTPVFVSSPELAHEVLVDKSDAFVKSPGLSVFARPLLGNGLLTSEGDTHRRHRRMIAPVFVQKRVAHYAEIMTERAERCQAGWSDGAVIDVADAMSRLSLEITGKALFDAEVAADADRVGAALTEAMRHIIDSLGSLLPLPPVVPSPANLRHRKVVAELDDVIFRMIRERRTSKKQRHDVLSMLIAARDEDGEGRMDDQEVRDEAMTIFLAGHETVANALAWSLFLLAQNPEVRDRVEQELDAALSGPPSLADVPRLPLTLAVFKEAMRLYPPAYIIGRRATRELRIGGEDVSRGTIVMVNIYGMHHRARYFADPERFDPERFLGEAERAIPRGAYLPFGAGARICIGNHFAMMEGHLVLATLLRHVRLDLVPGQEIEPAPLLTLRPRDGIQVTVRRR